MHKARVNCRQDKLVLISLDRSFHVSALSFFFARPFVESSLLKLWKSLFSHFVNVVTNHVMSAEKVGSMFGSLLISQNSRHGKEVRKHFLKFSAFVGSWTSTYSNVRLFGQPLSQRVATPSCSPVQQNGIRHFSAVVNFELFSSIFLWKFRLSSFFFFGFVRSKLYMYFQGTAVN